MLNSDYCCVHCSNRYAWGEINVHENHCELNPERRCRWCNRGDWSEEDITSHQLQCCSKPSAYRDPTLFKDVIAHGQPNGGRYWNDLCRPTNHHPVVAQIVRKQHALDILNTEHTNYHDANALPSPPDGPIGSVCSDPADWLTPDCGGNTIWISSSQSTQCSSEDTIDMLRSIPIGSPVDPSLPAFALPKLPPKVEFRHVQLPPTLKPEDAFKPNDVNRHVNNGFVNDPFALFHDDMERAPRHVTKKVPEEYENRVRARRQLCQFCCKTVPRKHLSQHECSCIANPLNQCKYCGRGFTASGSAKTDHQAVCSSSPFADAWCEYCEKNFKSNEDYGPAFDQLLHHERTCAQNPHIKCRFCRKPCIPTSDTISESNARLNHELRCIRNPDNHAECKYCGGYDVASLSMPKEPSSRMYLLPKNI
eukprot:GHVH01017414.1.p1 GENE.GHVH01017414.1~~GHVH01017414.1.p1  ORF type:complete len:429 (+),score=38.55 GHVH01017414.1:26-1288(+)